LSSKESDETENVTGNLNLQNQKSDGQNAENQSRNGKFVPAKIRSNNIAQQKLAVSQTVDVSQNVTQLESTKIAEGIVAAIYNGSIQQFADVHIDNEMGVIQFVYDIFKKYLPGTYASSRVFWKKSSGNDPFGQTFTMNQ